MRLCNTKFAMMRPTNLTHNLSLDCSIMTAQRSPEWFEAALFNVQTGMRQLQSIDASEFEIGTRHDVLAMTAHDECW